MKTTHNSKRVSLTELMVLIVFVFFAFIKLGFALPHKQSALYISLNYLLFSVIPILILYEKSFKHLYYGAVIVLLSISAHLTLFHYEIFASRNNPNSLHQNLRGEYQVSNVYQYCYGWLDYKDNYFKFNISPQQFNELVKNNSLTPTASSLSNDEIPNYWWNPNSILDPVSYSIKAVNNIEEPTIEVLYSAQQELCYLARH